VKYASTIHVIFVHERECWAGHVFEDSHTATNRLGERGLSGAEIALERDDCSSLQARAEPFPNGSEFLECQAKPLPR
jgi:hypothetical protein